MAYDIDMHSAKVTKAANGTVVNTSVRVSTQKPTVSPINGAITSSIGMEIFPQSNAPITVFVMPTMIDSMRIDVAGASAITSFGKFYVSTHSNFAIIMVCWHWCTTLTSV